MKKVLTENAMAARRINVLVKDSERFGRYVYASGKRIIEARGNASVLQVKILNDGMWAEAAEGDIVVK